MPSSGLRMMSLCSAWKWRMASGERVTDRETGLNYYKFTLTGKVAY